MSYLVLEREDFDFTRADLSLGLSRAARYYNELVVPGIGGGSRVRHFTWSVLGIYLKRKLETRANASVIAQSLEALGSKLSWQRIPEEMRRDLPIRGKLAFARNPDAWDFNQLSQTRFYVQITTRQSITRALPIDSGIGFTENSTRFNGMDLTAVGEEFAQCLSSQTGIGQGGPYLLKTLSNWLQGQFDVSSHLDGMENLIGIKPNADECGILRGQLQSELSVGTLFGVRDAKRRIRLTRYFETVVKDDKEWNNLSGLLLWLEKNEGQIHANDIRTALSFEAMRRAGVQVIAALVTQVQNHGQFSSLDSCSRSIKVLGALEQLRGASLKYQDMSNKGDNHREDALAFARETELEPKEAIRAITRRDNRILQVNGEKLCQGPVFRPDIIAESESTRDPDAQEAEQGSSEPWRLFRFLELWRDCHGQI